MFLINNCARKLVSNSTSQFFVQIRNHSFKAANLVNKKLVSVKGEHCYQYLQGLITNDIRHLYPNQTTSVHLDCIYSFVLLPNGRLFSDLFIYNQNTEELWIDDSPKPKLAEPDKYLLIECDGQISDKIVKYFKLHKLKSKVDFNYNNDFTIWSIYPGEMLDDQSDFPKIETIKTPQFFLTVDPRIKNHYRCLISKEADIKEILNHLEKKYNFPIVQSTLEDYTNYRYEIGIGEGSIDHPPGNCFPLECNGDFLHGISFHKGCYVGQELTARIHHTGVVRKRLLPVRLVHADSPENLETYINCDITSKIDDKKLGKLRTGRGRLGLGLLYIEPVILNQQLSGFLNSSDEKRISIETYKPFWWPKEVKLFNK